MCQTRTNNQPHLHLPRRLSHYQNGAARSPRSRPRSIQKLAAPSKTLHSAVSARRAQHWQTADLHLRCVRSLARSTVPRALPPASQRINTVVFLKCSIGTSAFRASQPGCTHSAKSTDPPSLLWNAANTPASRRRSAASAVGLPQRPAVILVLIVARGCVKRFSCRLTHFAASAVPKTMV